MQLKENQMIQALFRLAGALVLSVAGWVGPASAQGLFSPAITVNDKVITGYELQQRARMVQVLRTPGNPQEVAREQLIDDRLRLQAAEAAGIIPSPEEVLEGMAEFASRANLSREQFVQILASEGVSEQTFRDFVRAGLSWRLLVRARFGGRANVSEDELDRALASDGGVGNIRVLLSEIIIPAPPGQEQLVQDRANRIAQTRSEAAFSAAAREFSATSTRASGGRLPWRNLSDLPPPLQPIVLGLAPGEVTDPLPLPNAIALFQLRAIEETGYSAPRVAAVDYAMFMIPGGRSDAALAQARVIASRSDRCDDLYGLAKGQPPEVLERQTLPVGDIPTDIAFELSKLDPGETSTALTRNNGQSLVLLMLCGRTLEINQEADRDQLALGLRNQRLTALSDGYLAQLRAQARIIER